VSEQQEYLLAEVDRQLEEVREQALALATRAGLVLGAVVVATALLGAGMARISPDELTNVYWFIGIAGIAAIVALAPGLKVGPDPISLNRWRLAAPEQAIERLLDSKMILVGANRSRLTIMTYAFYIESGAVIVALIMALVAYMAG
jgi:hypothetical protein